MSALRLITRGDDAGSSRTANLAIRQACETGLLRNTSVLACCAELGHAAELLAELPGLCVGVHGCVNAEWDRVRWGPVLPPAEVPSLVDERGHFFQTTRALHEHGARLDEVLAELTAQLLRLRAVGFEVAYADSHMGFGWVADGLDEALADWRARHGLLAGDAGGRLPSTTVTGDPVEQLLARLEAAAPGTYLLVGHPAYDTAELRLCGHDGYPAEVVASGREWERRLFCDPRVMAYAAERGLQAIRFDEV